MPNPPPDDQWVQQYYARVHHAAWLLTGDAWAADDLTQETFVRAISRWQQFDGRAQASTWLYSIMLNVHRGRSRALGRAAQRLQRWLQRRAVEDQDLADPSVLLAAKTWKQSVWAEVSRLPAPQQHAVTLRFGEGLSFEQIAQVQRCAVGTAQTRVHYGLKKLRLRLAAKDWSEADLDMPLLRAIETPPT